MVMHHQGYLFKEWYLDLGNFGWMNVFYRRASGFLCCTGLSDTPACFGHGAAVHDSDRTVCMMLDSIPILRHVHGVGCQLRTAEIYCPLRAILLFRISIPVKVFYTL